MASSRVDGPAERLERCRRRRSTLQKAHHSLQRRLAVVDSSIRTEAGALPAPDAPPQPGRRPADKLTPAADSAQRPPSSYSQHAAISFADLLRMQGRSVQGSLDLSTASMRELAEGCRAGIADSVPVHSVCWFVQSRRAAAPGVGLSVSSTLSSPACAASMLLLWLSVQLECGLLLCESKYINAAREEAEGGGLGADADADADAAVHGSGAPSQRRHEQASLVTGPPQSPAPHAGPPPEEAAHASPPAVAAAGAQQTLIESAGECPSLSSGSNGASAAGASICSGAYAVRQHSASAYTFMHSSGRMVTAEGGADPGAGAFDRLRTGINGSVPLGEATQHIVEAVVRRFHRRLPRDQILSPLKRLLEELHAALEPLMRGSGGAGGTGTTAAASAEARAGAAVVAGAEAGAGDPSQAVRAELPSSARPLVSVSEAMCGSLANTIGKLGSEGPRAEVTVASPEAHERHLGDLQALMQDLELAIVLTGTDAGCALSQLMIMAFVRASRQPFQDESMHLNLYREMGLAAEQKQTMVALWRGWHSKRRALDDGVAAALASITAASPLSRALDLSLLAAGDDDGQSLQGTLMPMHAGAGRAAALGHGAALPARVAAWEEWYADPDAAFAHEDHMAAIAMHAGDAYDPACPESLLRRAGSAGPGHPWETMRVPPLMLGQCPSTTAAAKMACEALQGAHRSVAGQILDFTVFLMLPGEVFGPQELMRMMWEPVRASSGPVDKVELCLQAVQQQRREDVFEGVDNLAV